MDWRNRDYYLVEFEYTSEDMRRGYFKLVSPSVKYHKAYNHFKQFNTKPCFNQDWKHLDFYPRYMVSCRKDESEALEYELSKADRRDWNSEVHHVKLTKEMTGQ